MANVQVTFCKSNNDPREIPKSFSGDVVKTCELIEPFNLENPRLKLTLDTTLYGYSYAKLTLGSHNYIYTVNPNYTMQNGLMYISLEMSYIDTYSTEVLNAKAHITRSGSSQEKMIVDEMATQYADDKIQCVNLGHAFTSGKTFIWVKGLTWLDTERE